MTVLGGRSLLRQREFRLLWAGQSASAIGDALVILALPFAVLDLTESAADVGVVLAALTARLAVLALVGGVWADRLPRRRVMLVADGVRAMVQAAIATLLMTGAASLWQLVALTAVYAAATAFFQPAMLGAVPQVVADADLQPANALLGLTRELAFVAGQPVGGLIIAVFSPGAAFAVDAASFLVSALVLAAMRTANIGLTTREKFLLELRAGISAIRQRTWLWVVMAWSWAHLLLVVAPVYVLGPVVANRSLGGAVAWGIVTGSFSAGAVAGGAVAFRWRPPRPLLGAAQLQLLAALGPLLLAVAAPVPLIAMGQLAAGVASGFFTAVYLTALQEGVPFEMRSRVGSVYWLGTTVAISLGYVIAGRLAAAIGVDGVLTAAAAWAAVSTIIILLVPAVRKVRAASRPAEVN